MKLTKLDTLIHLAMKNGKLSPFIFRHTAETDTERLGLLVCVIRYVNGNIAA